MAKRERPVLPTKEEVAEAKIKATKPEKTLASREAALIEKYSSKPIKKGSMQFDSEHNKYSVEMKLECGHVERVFTSDVFQVKACHECKKAKSKAKLAELKAKAPKKDAAPAKGKAPKAEKKAASPTKAAPALADDFAPPPSGNGKKKSTKVADLLV